MAMYAREAIDFLSEYLTGYFSEINVFMWAVSMEYIQLESGDKRIQEITEASKKARKHFEALAQIIDKEDPEYIYKDPEFEIIPYTQRAVDLWNSLDIGELTYKVFQKTTVRKATLHCISLHPPYWSFAISEHTSSFR